MILTLHDVAQRVQALEAKVKELEDAHNHVVEKLEEGIRITNANFQGVLEALQRMDGK